MGEKTAAALCGLKRSMALHFLATLHSISEATAGAPLGNTCCDAQSRSRQMSNQEERFNAQREVE